MGCWIITEGVTASRAVKHLGKTSETNKNWSIRNIPRLNSVSDWSTQKSLLCDWLLARVCLQRAAGCGQSALVCCQWRNCGEERQRSEIVTVISWHLPALGDNNISTHRENICQKRIKPRWVRLGAFDLKWGQREGGGAEKMLEWGYYYVR